MAKLKRVEAIVASARFLDTRVAREAVKKASDEADLWRYYDSLGEVHYALNYRANALSRIDPFIADAEGEEVADQSPLEKLRGDDNTFADAIRLASLSWMVAGEHYLVPAQDNEARLEVRSSSEVKVTSDGVEVSEGPGTTRKVKADEVLRCHIRHPRYRQVADAPLRSVSAICEELLSASDAARALSTNRAASNGILALAQELSFGPVDPTSQAANLDSFESTLIAAVEAAKANPSSPTGRLPVMIQIPADLMEHAVKKFELVDSQVRYPENAYLDKLLLRLSQGLDVPPEILTGMAGVNHWNAFMIDDAAWSAHGRPFADALMSCWTTALRLPLEHHVSYRDSRVVAPADQTRVSLELYKLGALSLAKLLEVCGFAIEDQGDLVVKSSAPNEPEPGLPVTASANGTAPNGSRIAMLTATTRARVHQLLQMAIEMDGFSHIERRLRIVLTDALNETVALYGLTAEQSDVDTLVDKAMEAAATIVAQGLALPEDEREVPIEAARRVLQVAGGAG